jgi:hypothetical protein
MNPEDSGGTRTKYRNSCPTGIPAKNSCDIGKKQEFLRPPPKGGSCETFLQNKKKSSGILRNPGRNGFLGPRNKFLSYRKMQPSPVVSVFWLWREIVL